MTCALCGQNHEELVKVKTLDYSLCRRCHDKMIEIFEKVNEDAEDKS